MRDWVHTLNAAKSSIGSLSFPGPPPTTQMNLQTRLFQDLHRLDTQHSGTKILFNVQVAAIHLYFLLQGHRQPNRPVHFIFYIFYSFSSVSIHRHCLTSRAS